MKTLVAYFTKGGASKTYAEEIAKTLKENGFEAELVNLRERKPDISGYDLIIVGTGIRMFRIYGKWKYILKNKKTKEKKLAMYLSSGTAIENPQEAIDKWVNPLIKKYKLQPVSVGSFPGHIPEKFDEKGTMQNKVNPELARQWALELISKL